MQQIITITRNGHAIRTRVLPLQDHSALSQVVQRVLFTYFLGY